MRMRIVFSAIVLVWVILMVRIYYISIKSNTYYEEIANQNAIKVERLAPLRGSIMDAQGRPMAVNRLGFSVGITPHLSARSKEAILNEEIAFLSTLLKQDPEELKKRYLRKDSPYFQGFVTVIDFISYDAVIEHFSRISLRDNLKIVPSSKRHYPYGKLASHVIGYVGRANLDDYNEDPISRLTNHVGRTGIEHYYNAVLQGKEGERRTKVTAFNQEIEELSKTLPSSTDLELTIDLELQQYISEIFAEDAGAVVVMDVEDGKLLAAGSFPEYDLNQFVTGISHEAWQELMNNLDNPFTNKLVNGLYPPGSVVKMGVGLALLGTQKITRQTSYYCTASFELGGRNFRCWRDGGHGHTDLNKAIRESCDDYFYKASLKVGVDALTPVLERLGFGDRTGVDLPNEFIGTVPGRHWKMQRYQKPWYQGETLITSIGQGYFLSTPLQVALHTGILATGKKVTPHFVKRIDGEEVVYPVDEEILTEIEKAELPHIQKGMYEVANHPNGTAYWRLINSKIKVAAKTGTAQVVGIGQDVKKRIKEEEMEYFHRSHAWLTSYGPYKNPRYVVTVLVEHGGHGGQAAGPIVTKIYNKLEELGYIEAE
ncbi:penicillin-binding protein 2 [Sulfurospirillum sp. T05]|uniref:Penicillin-binding protein 2 n=1 Tax=Sulfurospirillum tamanense TaxID=2813362 RepID=A0ABS2WT16_9BACT|nr:penicillin-binding protein 2 [Sulfurospirillum tamanensis]MBN2964738.1 penicillin-binding protein 2 [Sulfurospirillum tamanensis]